MNHNNHNNNNNNKNKNKNEINNNMNKLAQIAQSYRDKLVAITNNMKRQSWFMTVMIRQSDTKQMVIWI